MPDKELIRSALKSVKYPGFSRDIVSFGLVENISISDGRVSVAIKLTTGDNTIPPKIKSAAEEAVNAVEGVGSVSIDVIVEQPKASSGTGGQQSKSEIPGVKYVVAVASGKGGVGKSTVAVNLACALSQILPEKGATKGVGILDCDIYGPSVPQMMGIGSKPDIQDEKIIPPSNYGIKVMSMALLIDESSPVVWRGPMINNAISQFAQHVNWEGLDVLVVDLPPGTGDAQLSLVQTFPVAGAVIVTTPQAVSVNITRRGAMMFEKVNVPIFGVCENMSYMDAGEGKKIHVFGEGGGKWTADALETTLLGQIPLDPELREGGDRGIPITVAYPKSTAAIEFRSIAESVWKSLESTDN